MSALLRLYGPEELAADGYPPEWHRVDLGSQGAYSFPGERWAPGIKDIVRVEADHRCVRCFHPYRSETAGERGEWSPCDERCDHAGPWRWRSTLEGHSGEWFVCDVDDTPEEHYALRNTAGTPGIEIEARWRILTVHHLDMVKANCRWWNLAALCQRCHLQIQGNVQMARVWPWEHSEWFRPYVAGYYAHAYLGQDLDRTEVEDRLDELLALERAA